MMIYGRYAPELASLLRQLVHPGDSVLDVGAQLGFTTSLLAELVGPEGRVQSLEPDPIALSQLRSTVAANDQRQVTIFPVAAGNEDGELTFHLSPTIGWSTAVAGSHHRDLETARVSTVRIDQLDAEGRLMRPVRLVKIDVEGWECAVLDGMQNLLARDRPYVIAELSPLLLAPNGLTPSDVLDRIVRHRYRIYRLSEADGMFSGGRFTLTPVDPAQSIEFCDVLCVPEERSL